MLKKILMFSYRFWGDILIALTIPAFIVFIIQILYRDTFYRLTDYGPEIVVRNFELYVSGRNFAIAMFVVFVSAIVFSAINIKLRQKRQLRDYSYLLSAFFSMLCFVRYLPVNPNLNHIVSDYYFPFLFALLVIVWLLIYCSRISIWLFRKWQAKQAPQEEK